LISEKDEDPLFNDDWEASTYLYPRSSNKTSSAPVAKPPITLLVMTVGPSTILFDPSKEELAVADAVVAISIASTADPAAPFKVIALRTIDPPSRLTAAGVLNTTTITTASSAGAAVVVVPPEQAAAMRELDGGKTVWRPSRGGVGRAVLATMVKAVVEKGGVGEEVLAGLEGVEV
jgi:exosome complex component RRP42